MDALFPVSALELLGRTRYGRAAFFVFVVETIVIAVANPRLRDAMAGTRAGELKISARLLGAEICRDCR